MPFLYTQRILHCSTLDTCIYDTFSMKHTVAFCLTRYFPNDYLSSAPCLSNEQKSARRQNKPQRKNEKATMHHRFSRGKKGTNEKSIETQLLLNTRKRHL